MSVPAMGLSQQTLVFFFFIFEIGRFIAKGKGKGKKVPSWGETVKN